MVLALPVYLNQRYSYGHNKFLKKLRGVLLSATVNHEGPKRICACCGVAGALDGLMQSWAMVTDTEAQQLLRSKGEQNGSQALA
ncbi:hypothetical protein [Nitrosovibrio sp. Nv6]|uniref:hypothetical protein n=1 Tax=Nitrosovibrio sp. Nv6 TaxID=1855340 RepID=UPI0008B8DF2B|nr:hypothetical protein [Nitrosovibrio sp. Nv6]SEP21696.1 hypothetical protein SAMN05216316_2061 [Nitrosovibrio sp. Nv6]